MLNKRAASVCAAALVIAAPAGTASATDKPERPQPGPWESFDDTLVLSAGTACKHTVIERFRGASRVTELAEDRIFVEYADWSYSTFVNRKNNKRIRVNAGGDVWARFLDAGNVIKIRYQGNNYNQGRGVKGILYTEGDVTFTVVNANDPVAARVVNNDVSDARKVKQLCYSLGSKPVWGQNVEPEASTAGESSSAGRH